MLRFVSNNICYYFGDYMNRFDLFVVTIGVIEMTINTFIIQSPVGHILSGLMQSLRVMRLLRIARYWDRFKKLI